MIEVILSVARSDDLPDGDLLYAQEFSVWAFLECFFREDRQPGSFTNQVRLGRISSGVCVQSKEPVRQVVADMILPSFP